MFDIDQPEHKKNPFSVPNEEYFEKLNAEVRNKTGKMRYGDSEIDFKWFLKFASIPLSLLCIVLFLAYQAYQPLSKNTENQSTEVALISEDIIAEYLVAEAGVSEDELISNLTSEDLSALESELALIQTNTDDILQDIDIEDLEDYL